MNAYIVPMGSQAISRRAFLAGGAATVLAARTAVAARASASSQTLPRPAASGLDHVVVVMMENRSFDHMLGWLPGADGKQAGLSYIDRTGVRHSTYPLAPDFQGCGYEDPDHSYDGSRIAYAGGRCDGWLRAGGNDLYAIGYYGQRDLPFLGNAAPAFTTCDRYFAPIMGPTFANRMYVHAGRTDRTDDLPLPSGLPTIWDSLRRRGIAAAYYHRNFSFLALWGAKYARESQPWRRFLAACASGDLPAVSFVDPSYTLPLLKLSYGDDDHPPSDIRAGEWFLSQVYDAVTSSPAWPRTLLVITFDEWGGFFDHVRPAFAPDVSRIYSLRGFRVPTVLVSPFARRGHVDHGVYDHTSILKLIEWRFGLPALSVRDARARNLAAALDFARPNTSVPRIVVPRLENSPQCPR
jgi:phospholipase C